MRSRSAKVIVFVSVTHDILILIPSHRVRICEVLVKNMQTGKGANMQKRTIDDLIFAHLHIANLQIVLLIIQFQLTQIHSKA